MFKQRLNLDVVHVPYKGGGPSVAATVAGETQFSFENPASSLPLVFHCAAGKDRTGVVAAVVLSVLGVKDDDIADDYSLSRLGMGRFKEWIIATFPDYADSMTQQPDAFLAAPVEAMHLFLERVRDHYRSVDAYVEGLGVSDDTLDAVRQNLLT